MRRYKNKFQEKIEIKHYSTKVAVTLLSGLISSFGITYYMYIVHGAFNPLFSAGFGIAVINVFLLSFRLVK